MRTLRCIRLAVLALLLHCASHMPRAAAQSTNSSSTGSSSLSSSAFASSSLLPNSTLSSTASLTSSSSSNLSGSNSSSSSSTGAGVVALGSASTGLIIYGVVCFIGVIVFTSYLVNRYARPGAPPIALLLTWLSWLITFSICFLVPIDLLPSVGTALNSVWSTLYWMAFLLMWLVIPFFSGYYDNGGFTWRQKCMASLRFNAVLALVAIVVAGAGTIYLVAQASWSTTDVANMAVLASTTWGLIMLVVSGGWGLVEVPRALRQYINTERRRNYIYFTAASVHHEAEEARDDLLATIQLLRLMEPRLYAKVEAGEGGRKQAGAAGKRQPRDADEEEAGEGEGNDESDRLSQHGDESTTLALHRLHFAYFKQIQAVVRTKEAELEQLKRQPRGVELPFKQELLAASLSANSLSLRQLTALHYHTMLATKRLTVVETQWRDTVDSAVQLEQDVTNDGNARQASWFLRTGRRKLLYGAYIFACVMSLLILVCELVVPVTHPNISPLGQLVSLTNSFFLSEQVFTAVPLLYLSFCAYYPLFQLRLPNLYYLGRHRSDESTLLLNCTLLLRISVPLAYNFTLLLHQDAASLSAFIGQVSDIPFFGATFNTIFPVFMVAIALLVLSRVFNYVLVCLNVNTLRFDLVQKSEDDAEIKDLMDEGKQLIQNELRRRTKLAGSAQPQPSNGKAERTVVDGLTDRVKSKLAAREGRRTAEDREVRERMVELGTGRAGQRERRHRSDELAGAMGEGMEEGEWREDDSAGSGGQRHGAGDAYYHDAAASGMGRGWGGGGGVDSGEYEYGEERVYDEEGYDQDGFDANGYDRYGGYYDEDGQYIAPDQEQ